MTLITNLRPKRKQLPPDADGMNRERADWAGLALEAFQNATRVDNEDVVADLLADMMHWCDRYGFNFLAELHRAERHYSEETADEDTN